MNSIMGDKNQKIIQHAANDITRRDMLISSVFEVRC
jgi:hypothetical protein